MDDETDLNVVKDDIPAADAEVASADAEGTEVDLDAAETAAAEADAEAEETGTPVAEGEAAADAKPTENADQTDAQAAPIEDGKGKIPADNPMVPIQRLNKATGQRDQATMEAAYWKGVAEGTQQARTADPAPVVVGEDGQPIPQGAQPTDRKAEIVAEQAAAAQQFDDGKLTAREWEEARAPLDEELTSIRIAEANVPQPEGQESQGDSLYLDQMTAGLEEKHEYLAKIEGADNWDFILRTARAELVAEGALPAEYGDALKPITNDRLMYVQRERMATLSDKFGPAMTNGEPAPAPQPATPPTEGQGKGLSANAIARQNKLDLAERHPPDSASLGSTGDRIEFTEERINAMSEEELEMVPEALLRKFDPAYSGP